MTVKNNQRDMSFYYDESNRTIHLYNRPLDQIPNKYQKVILNSLFGINSFDVCNFVIEDDIQPEIIDWFCTRDTLIDIDLLKLDTSNINDMSYLFFGCKELKRLDLTNFDTSNTSDMYSMFTYCSSLTALDLSNFNTSKVTNMCNMFYNCSNLNCLNVNNFDISNVIDMSEMFYNCYSITSLDLSNWDNSNVKDSQDMFKNMIHLEKISLGKNWEWKNKGFLPTPSNKYINGADGKWHTANGKSYLPEEIPNNVIDTYYAVPKF